MESPLTPFSSAFDMPAPRDRKFASVVNLCGGFHPRSSSLGNKYESLVRGCSTSRLGVIPTSRLSLDIRRYAIRPDFRGELKFPFVVCDDAACIFATANACEISYVHPRHTARSFIRDQEFPRRRLRRRLSRVSPVEGIFSALPSHFSPLAF